VIEKILSDFLTIVYNSIQDVSPLYGNIYFSLKSYSINYYKAAN